MTVTRGAQFINNAAGGYGGAIWIGSATGNRSVITLTATNGDMVFKGNREQVMIDYDGVDYDKVLDRENPAAGGYMTWSSASGRKNDINFYTSGTASTMAGTLNLNAGGGNTIYFDGGISQSAWFSDTTTAMTITRDSYKNVTINKTGVGLVVFDGALVSINAVTTVSAGTLSLRGGMDYGYSGTMAQAAGTKFTLNGGATLEGNATVNAETIQINNDAIIRVIEDGNLVMNSSAVTFGTGLTIAGSGTLSAGTGAINNIKAISIGDIGHTSAQTLTLVDTNTSPALNATFSDATLAAGLFSGGADRLVLNKADFSNTSLTIDLSSVGGSGARTLVSTAAGITGYDSASTTLTFKGAQIQGGDRLAYSASLDGSGNNLLLTYTASNDTVSWTGGSGANWTLGDANWSISGVTGKKYILGDIVNFGADRNGDVTVAENTGVSRINASGNYTFTGDGGITIRGDFWNGSNSGADGLLVKTGANTLVTLANATGAGSANEFAGIRIESGTLAFGTAAQLGAALSKVQIIGAASDNSTLAVVGDTVLSGDTGSQRLAIDAGNVATLAIMGGAASLTIKDNIESTGNGGVFFVDTGATLNIIAEGTVHLSGNQAALGGAMYLAAGATASITASGSDTIISYGQSADYDMRTDANITTMDSLASEDASASIYKRGAGTLKLNSDSSAFKGTLVIDAGSVFLGENSKLGGSVETHNAGSIFGGGGVLSGNLTASAGAMLSLGNAGALGAQTLMITGTASLDDATISFGGFDANNAARTNHLIADTLELNGETTFDFNFSNLTSGTYHIATVTGLHEETFAISSITYAQDESTGSMSPTGTHSGFADVMVANLYNSGSILITNNGNALEGGRSTARIAFGQAVASGTIDVLAVVDPESGETIMSGTSLTGTSGTDTYYTGQIYVDVITRNYLMTWSGSMGNRWASKVENWFSDSVASLEFMGGDAVLFDGVTDAANEGNRAIDIHSAGVTVGGMTVTGTGNYIFTGGQITGVDSTKGSTLEGASGMFVMDGSGTVTFLNVSNVFTGSGGGPTFRINNGTVVGTAFNLSNNHIANDGRLVFNQATSAGFVGTVSGAGNIIKSGAGMLALQNGNSMQASGMSIEEGGVSVDGGYLAITSMLNIEPQATLLLADSVSAATLRNSGTVGSNNTSASPAAMTIIGNYVGQPNSVINLLYRAFDDGASSALFNQTGLAGSDSLTITGNATGRTSVHFSGTVYVGGTNVNVPAPRRDMRIITILGESNMDVDINGHDVGEAFQRQYTSGDETHTFDLMMLKGRDGNYYLRNLNVMPTAFNMPVIGVAPALSEFIGRAGVDSLYQRINARHEKIEKGAVIWSNYSYGDTRLKNELYPDVHLKTNLIQLGAETAICNGGSDSGISLLAGASYAYVSGNADFSRMSALTSSGGPAARVEADTHTISAYAEARLGRLYADTLIYYSPDASFKATTQSPLDSNGTVKGNRLGASIEIGYILHPPKGGQWEPFARLDYQNSSFGGISNPEQANSFESNGRDYNFDGYSGFRAMGGIRAGANLSLSDKLTLRPWGSVSGGRAFNQKADIKVGQFTMDNSLSAAFYSYSGGLAARWNNSLTVYFTASWTGGDDCNGYTFTGGANYRW
jgi:autotransporter-associated beta strand protein